MINNDNLLIWKWQQKKLLAAAKSKGSGTDWSTYWTTLISATVENAAPTHVVLTFPAAQTSLGATDFTIAGFTISSASWTGPVLTIVLSSPVLLFHGDLTITFITTGQTATITNNVAAPANAKAWYDQSDAATITKDGSDFVSIWWDKLIGTSTLGAEQNSGVIVLFAVYKITATEENFFYDGCVVGATFVCAAVKTCDANNKVQRYTGNHLTQHTTDRYPTKLISGVLFPGAFQKLKTAPFVFAQPEYIYLVFRQVIWGEGERIFDGVSDNAGMVTQGTTTSKFRAYAGAYSTENPDMEINTWAIMRVAFSGAASKLQIDAHDPITGNFGAAAMGAFTLGGQAVANSYNSNIEVKEAILCDSDTGESDIYNYLKNKYKYNVILENFVNYAATPILSPEVDETSSTFCSVLKVDDTYHMYYHSGYGNIGHATSADGKTWVKDAANNPVLDVSVGEWDSDAVGVPMVWKEGSIWYMLYRGQPALTGGDATGLATSADGITWTKSASNPVLQGEADKWDTGAETWGVIKRGSIYYLYYESRSPVERKIGVATSTDLITWTKDVNNPIFDGGRFCPFAFKYDDYYYLIVPHYTIGVDFAVFELYRDISPTFYPADRVYLGIIKKYSASGGWDDHDLDTPCILTDDIYRDTFVASNGELWMYYAGEPGDDTWKVGLTISKVFDL